MAAGYHAQEQLDARRIDPLTVLDDHQDRLLARGRDEDLDNHLKNTLALGGRTEVGRLVFAEGWYRQQGSVIAKSVLDIGKGSRQQRAQFRYRELGVVGFLNARRAPQPLDFRGKRRVDVKRRALIRQNINRKCSNGATQLADEAALGESAIVLYTAHPSRPPVAPPPPPRKQLHFRLLGEARPSWP